MATTTKELIYRTFLDLLRQKPFDKITVRDIVESANINRNTFYYYYSDIYELLEEIFSVEESKMVETHSEGFRWLVAFSNLLDISYSNKKIINNICASRSYEYLETYMFKSSKMILNDYVHKLVEGHDVPEQTVDFIISFYHYAVSGCLTEWYRTGMRETPEEILAEFMLMFEGLVNTVDRAIERQNDADSF